MPLYTLQELQRLSTDVANPFREALAILPHAPATMKATGLKLSNRVEWSQDVGCDGYRVAAMPSTALNLSAPQKLFTVQGETALEFIENVGDVATLRYYSVQSFKRTNAGETYFSEWHYPLVSATSKTDGGAVDTAPTAPPSAPIVPEDSGTPGDPGGVSSGELFIQ